MHISHRGEGVSEGMYSALLYSGVFKNRIKPFKNGAVIQISIESIKNNENLAVNNTNCFLSLNINLCFLAYKNLVL